MVNPSLKETTTLPVGKNLFKVSKITLEQPSLEQPSYKRSNVIFLTLSRSFPTELMIEIFALSILSLK